MHAQLFHRNWHSFLNLPNDLSFAYCFMTTHRSWRQNWKSHLFVFHLNAMSMERWTMTSTPAKCSIGHDVDFARMTHFDRAFAFPFGNCNKDITEWNGNDLKGRRKKKKCFYVSNESKSSLETVITADGRQCLSIHYRNRKIEKPLFQWTQSDRIRKRKKKTRTNNYLFAGEIKVFIPKLRLIQWKYIPNRSFIIVSRRLVVPLNVWIDLMVLYIEKKGAKNKTRCFWSD